MLTNTTPDAVQERYLVEQLGAPGFFHIIARYGYTQHVQQVRNRFWCCSSQDIGVI